MSNIFETLLYPVVVIILILLVAYTVDLTEKLILRIELYMIERRLKKRREEK